MPHRRLLRCRHANFHGFAVYGRDEQRNQSAIWEIANSNFCVGSVKNSVPRTQNGCNKGCTAALQSPDGEEDLFPRDNAAVSVLFRGCARDVQ